MGTPPAFACVPLARITHAKRCSAYQLWLVTTTHADHYTVIATDAHDARSQVNEMLQRIRSTDRAQIITHSHVMKEQTIWQKIKSIPLPCRGQALTGLRASST